MTTYVSAPITWGVTNVTPADSLFRSRCLAIHNAIVGAGLVQTADTGQIDFATVTVGTTLDTERGYAVYRFNDADQSTWPVFLRVSFRTGSGSTGRTAIVVTVGTATNGAGVISANALASSSIGRTHTTNGTVVSVQIYACHVQGYFMLTVGPGNSLTSAPLISISVSRSRDDSGNFDGKTIVIWDSGENTATPLLGAIRVASPASIGSRTAHFCIVPGQMVTSTLLNGDKQLYPHIYATPESRILWSQFTVNQDEFTSTPTTFTARPVNNVSRTFIFFGTGNSTIGDVTYDGRYRPAFLWE